MITKQQTLPVLPLRGLPVYPYMIIHFDAGRDFTIKAIETAMEEGGLIMLISQRDFEVAEPKESDLYSIGTIAKIRQVLKHSEDDFRIAVEGVSRATVDRFIHTRPYFLAEVTEILDLPLSDDEKTVGDVYMERIRQHLDEKQQYGYSLLRFGKDSITRQHICLVDWDELDNLSQIEKEMVGNNQDYKQKDRNNVLAIPQLIAIGR